MLLIISINARIISNRNKVEQIRNKIEDQRPDIILMQEISMTTINGGYQQEGTN